VPVDQAQSSANGHQRGEDSTRQMPFLRTIFEGPIKYPNGRFRMLWFHQPVNRRPKLQTQRRLQAVDTLCGRIEHPILSLRRVLFKEQVDIFPAVFIEPDRVARARVTQSLVAMEIGSVEGVEQMTKPIRVWAIFSIRFRLFKKYVGLFEVARIWVAFAPVALKARLACAKVRWNPQGHITVTILRV